MNSETLCPHCGKPVPPSALAGICPECMLKAGAATQTERGGTKIAFPPPKPEEIAALFPQLEIIECLGRGGMGAVYKARQPKLARFVALKILTREREGDPKFTERFEREAQALARLNHPNIVTVYDFGEAGGHCYLLMEYVDGPNLRRVQQSGRLAPREALSIVPQLCAALQFAHDAGIVHRDIKPENILLDKQGRVKIADFGIAKLVGGDAGPSHLTADQQIIGTPHYMAPEQIERPQAVDHRADIYSLGVVFYEMLTGELPLGKFQPPSMKVQVDVRLDEVVLRALAKEPERRYQHASDVKSEVETIAGSPSRPAGVREKSPAELRPALRAPLAVLGLVLLGYFIFLFHSSADLPERFATHFDFDGRPNGWMSRMAHLLFMSAAGFGLPLFFAALGFALRFFPDRSFNIPHREFWLAPERRYETCAFIFRRMLWFACLIVGFLAGIQYVIVRANAAATAQLPAVSFALLVDNFLVATALWTFSLLHHFFQPAAADAARASTPRRIPRRLWPTLVTLAVLFFLWSFVVAPYRGASDSVSPEIPRGSHVFVFKLARNFSRGDVIVYRRDGVNLLGRVAEDGPRDGVLQVSRRDGVAAIQAATIVGKVIFNTRESSEPANAIKSDYIGQTYFPGDDTIEIVSVDRNRERIIVRGRYNLASVDRAQLSVNITSTVVTNLPEGAKQSLQISKGRGDFELVHDHPVPGMPHVTIYSGGTGIADVYFGTREEAEAERGIKFNSGPARDAAAPADANASHAEALNGLFYLSQRKYTEAEAALLRAAPQAPEAWYGLARLYLLQGNFAQAEKWAQKLVDAGQTDELARPMLNAAQVKQLSDELRTVIEPPAPSAETGKRSVDALPPVVVRTFPVSGAADVAPGVAEIKVTFSKEMKTNSWSWSTAWTDSTPESLEPPHYDADRRTCVLKVKLEAGRTYAYWLNSEQFQNFKDWSGQASVPYLLIFKTREANGSP